MPVTLSTGQTVPYKPNTGTITVTFSGTGANRFEWIGLCLESEPDPSGASDLLNWKYLNDTQVAPGSPISSGTVTFPVPDYGGPLRLWFFADNTYSLKTRHGSVDIYTLKDMVDVKVLAFGLEPSTIPNASRAVVGVSTLSATLQVDYTSSNWHTWWTDLTSYVTDIDIKRGRTAPLSAPTGGSCRLTFESADRRFDPNWGSSPYMAGGSRLFKRGLPIIVALRTNSTGVGYTGSQNETDWFPLFAGFLDTVEVEYGWANPLYTTRASCTDAWDALTRHPERASFDRPEEAGDVRAASWLWGSILDPDATESPITSGPIRFHPGRRSYGADVSNTRTSAPLCAAETGLSGQPATGLLGAIQHIRYQFVDVDSAGRIRSFCDADFGTPYSIADYYLGTGGGSTRPRLDNHVLLVEPPRILHDDSAVVSTAEFKTAESRVAGAAAGAGVTTVTGSLDGAAPANVRFSFSTQVRSADLSTHVAQPFIDVYGSSEPRLFTVACRPYQDDRAMQMLLDQVDAIGTELNLYWGRDSITYTDIVVIGVEHSIRPNREWLMTLVATDAPYGITGRGAAPPSS